ncbi:MAG: hypothetical protein IJ658_10465 [Kiritimatiellae bacterium]|nr:hypothetical protein [Kiritimatiellia bacterium]
MAKEVTVLSLEGKCLRGVRLAESGGTLSRPVAETWALAADAQERVPPDGDSGSPADAGESQLAAATSEAADANGDDEDQAGDAMSAADLLAQSLHEAATVFKTREFMLSVPLSRLLVKVVRLPVDEREDLEETAQDALQKVSPFPDEPLAVGVETVAETDKEIVAVAAALPESACEDISAALAAANVNVTRTDITALGRLRAFWPQICEKDGAVRRLVLMNLDDGWDVMVLDDGAPVFLRGLGGGARTPDELARDVMLSLLQGEAFGGARAIDDVVVFSETPVDEETVRKLSTFGPVRVAEATQDEYESAEGVAQRAAEGSVCDVTPASWTAALREARFRKKLTIGVTAAMAMWLAIMGVFFGVPFVYGQLAARQQAQSKRHQSAYNEAKSIQNKLKMVQGYSDREHGALMLLKRVADALPGEEGDEIRLREFRYTRDDAVQLQVIADSQSALDYQKALHELEDDEGNKLFPGGVEIPGGMSKNQFRIQATLKEPDEDDRKPVRRAGGRKGTR